MKRVIILCLMIVTCSTMFAQNRGPGSNVSDVSSIVGSPRGPLQGRTTTVNPYNPNIGNDIVTGNVGGGKHFRHTVPYASSSEFGSSLYDTGSQSVSSFIRRSSVDPFTSGRPYYQSYYDPRTTVTSINRGGLSGLTRPQNYSQVPLPDYTAPRAAVSESDYYRRQPLSIPSEKMEYLIKQQMGIKEILRRDEFFQEKMDQKQAPDEVERLKEILLKTDQTEPDSPEKTDSQKIDEMENELLNELLETDTAKEDQEPEVKEDTQKPAETDDSQASEDRAAQTDQVDDILRQSAQYYRTRASRILGEHKDYKSLARAKVAEFVEQASKYMINDKFYKASQSYELAMVWSRNDPQLYHDNALALFAAGSYLSASLQLDQAMRLDKDLVKKKIDLRDHIINRDVIENRLIELKTLQKNTNSAYLSYLLAYISYRDGKMAQADEAIKIALEMSPDNPSMLAVQNAIKK